MARRVRRPSNKGAFTGIMGDTRGTKPLPRKPPPKKPPLLLGTLTRADRPITRARDTAARNVRRTEARLPNPPRSIPKATKRAVIEHTARTVPVDTYRLDREVRKAKGGKASDPSILRTAIGLGRGKGLNEQPEGFFNKKTRRLLPDANYPVLSPAGRPLAMEGQIQAATKRVGRLKAESPQGAAAGKVLDVVSRPLHAVAGTVKATVEGGSPGEISKAATENLTGGRHDTFGKVLHESYGVPKGVAGVVGFGLDIGLDPLTYVTFGAAPVARKAAESAAKSAAAKATAHGLSDQQVEQFARRAFEQTLKKHPHKGRGLTVKWGSDKPAKSAPELPGVRRGTAAVGRGVKKVAGRAPGPVLRGAGHVKNAARDVRPSMKPAGVGDEEFQAGRAAARRSRATRNVAQTASEAEARALEKQIGPENYARVIDAIERSRIGSLPAELRQPALDLRSYLRHAKKVRRQAGVPEGEVGGSTTKLTEPALTKRGRLTRGSVKVRNEGPKGYFPHAQDEPLKQGLGINPDETPSRAYVGGPRRVQAPGSAKSRQIKTTLAEANKTLGAEHKFSTNVPLVHANYRTETSKAAAQSQLVKDLAASGRTVKPGSTVDLKDGEAIYHLGYKDRTFGLREVKSADWSADRVAKSGKFVVLHKQNVENALKAAKPAQADSTFGRGLDKATRGWKTFIYLNPGFHVRNAIGDTALGYFAQPGRHLIPNSIQAGRALKHLSAKERDALGHLGGRTTSDETIVVAGKPVKMDDFLKDAVDSGVVRSGLIGRDLEDLAGHAVKGTKRTRKQLGSHVKRWLANREDLMRLATYKSALDRGMSKAKAAQHSLDAHIDYGELTNFERQLRRAFPFYTFTARGIPILAKTLAQRPGKLAAYEKLREEVATATGLDLQQAQGDLTEYQDRQAPVLIKNGGKVFEISASLPLTLLNELPIDTMKVAGVSVPFIKSPRKYADELGQLLLSMANPVAKTPVELYANESFFFRRPIQDPNRPLVAAPGWVSILPKDVREKLGITDRWVDPTSAKKTWGWPGKLDYIVKQFPGVPNQINQLVSPGSNRGGAGTTAKAVGAVTGVTVQPVDKVASEQSRLYNELAKVSEKIAGLNQQGIKKGTGTQEWADLRRRQRTLERRIYQLALKRGDRTPPTAGRPSLARPKSPAAGLGGGLGGGGVGGGVGGGF